MGWSEEEDQNKDNNKTIDHDNVDEKANDKDEDEIVIDGNENENLYKTEGNDDASSS